MSDLLYNLGRWVGFFGFICLSLLIISGDTARFFDRFFGLDRIIKFQRKFSLFIAIFILFHPTFFILADSSIARNLIFPDWSLFSFACGIIAFYILLLITVASRIYKRISYKTWQYLHILTYVLFFTAFYHALNWGSHGGLVTYKVIYYFLFSAVIIAIIYRTQYKIRKIFGPKFVVKELRKETEDTITLILSCSASFNYRAGQFCFLRLNKAKLYARHPFSLSNPPGGGEVWFTIKNTGRFTEAALKLKPGEEVIVDGPFGNFILDDDGRDLIFIAGGVGITPFMSMLLQNSRSDIKRNMTLLYSVKNTHEIIFRDIIDRIQGNWFKKIYFVSRERTVYPNESGRISKDSLEKYVRDVVNSSFYICGPETMKNSMIYNLRSLGVKKKNIKVEDFFW